jgi:hypothetical protein
LAEVNVLGSQGKATVVVKSDNTTLGFGSAYGKALLATLLA